MEYDKRYAYKAMTILAPLAIIVLYTESMLIPSLTTIENEFGVNESLVSWVITVYLLTGTTFNPIIGRLGDIYGKKRVLTVLMWLYALAVTLTGFSPTFSFLILFRAIQGLGLGMFPLAFSLIREEFPPKLVPRAQGLVSAMFGVGSAIGLPLGAYISQSFGWQFTYHSVIPFVVILAFLTSKEIRESRFRNSNMKIDYLGSSTLGLGLGLLLVAVSEAPSWGWLSGETISFILLSLTSFISFGLIERKVPNPLLSLNILKKRNVLVANLAAFMAGFALFMSYQTLTFLFELPNPVGFGLDILSTGLTLFPLGIIQLLVGPISGALVSKMGPKPLIISGSIITSFSFLIQSILSLSGPSIGLGNYLIVAMMTMIGATVLNVSLVNLLIFSISNKVMGVGTAMNTVFRTMGGAVGPAIAGAVMSTYQSPLVFNLNGLYIVKFLPSDYSFSLIFELSSLSSLILTILTTFTNNVKPWEGLGGKID